MYLIILKLVLPYIQKIAAQQITDYLNRRREEKAKDAKETKEEAKEFVEDVREGIAECPPCPSSTSETSVAAPYNFFSTTNTIFFALSGLLLGTALTAIFYVFWKDLSSQE